MFIQSMRVVLLILLTTLLLTSIGCNLNRNPVQQNPENSYKLVFLNRDGDVCVLQNIYAPKVIPLTHDGGNAIPKWQPGGPNIAFISFSSEDSRYAAGLFIIKSDGTNRKFLAGISENNQAFSQELNWAPNGSRVAFVSPLNAVSGEQNIWIIDTNGSNKLQLTRGGHHVRPVWLPDGERIACTKLEFSDQSHTIVQSNLLIANLNTGGIMPYLPTNSSALHFSPDNQTVAFTRYNPIAQTKELYLANIDGTNIRQITHDGEWRLANAPFGFTADNGKIFFTSYVSFNYVLSNVEITTIDTSGTNRQVVKNVENFAEAILSPDRRKILLSVWRESRGVKTWMDIYILSTDGKEYFKLLEEVRFASWGPMN